jgi:hypothetical protein
LATLLAGIPPPPRHLASRYSCSVTSDIKIDPYFHDKEFSLFTKMNQFTKFRRSKPENALLCVKSICVRLSDTNFGENPDDFDDVDDAGIETCKA